uniref:Uncharacterized protein n=1 Tax=Odontella aurita TaxID=265563 RepID=A0A7S4K468_9STRA|mmetsp:Transcript_61310/g.181291  ORF Transcript_61310/g.181291 Transcript_61310/m.181291 type:complete len:532 (+) Transcript_61310:58-1653(+)
MTGATGAVLIAAASSVAKVFLIAIVGFLAVKHPRGNPLIPKESVGMLSRFAFTVLNLPLVYSSMGSTLTIDVLGSLWFVPLAGVAVIAISFAAATITERLPFFRIEHRVDLDALRVACSFPNVVAIPILVFPSLCEYEVVWSTFVDKAADMNRSPIEECTNSLNAMVFSYFFAWLFMFFLMGNQMLVNAGRRKNLEESMSRSNGVDVEVESTEGEGGGTHTRTGCQSLDGTQQQDDRDDLIDDTLEGRQSSLDDAAESTKSVIGSFLLAVKRAVLNPGSIAMWAGLITALIAPLQAALFAPGGALRFAGSAIESLAAALPSVATMITAASLVPDGSGPDGEGDTAERSSGNGGRRKCASWIWPLKFLREGNTIVDPNYMGVAARTAELQQKDRRPSLARIRRASARFGRQSLRVVRSPTVRMHIWFNVTRLLITPLIITAILVGLDCSTNLFGATIPHMAKLVVILNSSIPSAMLVILSLKSEGLSESAAVLARVYVPSYVLSIFTISGWTSVGLLLSIPNEEGQYFCEAR